MNLCKAKTVLLAWLLSIMSNNVDDGFGQDSAISCKAKGVPAGETASVTCYFNIDIRQGQRTLIVEKFIPDQTEDPPETVSYCSWSKGEPQCTNKDGITCEIANDHMELQFRKATQDCEGLYTCNLLPPDGTPVHSCLLKLADTPSTEQPSEYTTTTEETCKTTSTENCENLEAKVNGLIAGLVVVLVILLAVIVIFFLFYKRSRYRCVDCRSRQRREHDEDLSSEVDVRFSGLPEPSEDERDSPHPLEPLTQQ